MNIPVRLGKNFVTQFNKLIAKYGTEMARLNGVDEDQLSFVDFIDNFIDEDITADGSVDESANVHTNNAATLLREMSKPHQNLICMNKLYYEMQKKYGFKTANQWLELNFTRALYMHDMPTATFVHYCFAYDLKDVAEKGLYFLPEHNAEPPKHLGTFCRFVTEHTGYFSNLSSGACGYPNLIPYMYYFWREDKKNNYLGITQWEAYAKQNVQELVYQWNQPITRDGLQSAFTNVTIFDHPYLEALFGGAEFPDGSFMIDDIEGIMEFQKLFLETTEEIRGVNVMTYPVLSISNLYKDGDFADPEFVDWAVETDRKWMLANWFGDDTVTSLSNCCRLKSDIDELGYFNSIGGTALKVGSCKVSTINLARIALETNSPDEFLVRLRDVCEINLKVLDVQRHIIQRNVEKNLLPNFSCGEVDFEHLYSTTGVLSPYEALKTFDLIKVDKFGNTYYTPEADRFVEKIFKVLHTTIDNFSLDKNYKLNIESIPGESAASKMMKADQMLFGDRVINDLPLYGNQYLPLGIQATLQERIRVASLYDGFCNGGSILHVNIDAPFDSNEKMKQMLHYIFNKGVTYFAFTSKINACEKNHGFYGDICPTCGKPAKYSYARVVGFWTKIENWGSARREEGKMRLWEDVNNWKE